MHFVDLFKKPRMCPFCKIHFKHGAKNDTPIQPSQKTTYAISNEKLFYVPFLKLILVFVKITSSKTSNKQIILDKKQVSFILFITVMFATVVHEYFLTNACLKPS